MKYCLKVFIYSCIEKFKIPSFNSRSVMQGTVIANEKTGRFDIHMFVHRNIITNYSQQDATLL
jgi:hypothetical protein